MFSPTSPASSPRSITSEHGIGDIDPLNRLFEPQTQCPTLDQFDVNESDFEEFFMALDPEDCAALVQQSAASAASAAPAEAARQQLQSATAPPPEPPGPLALANDSSNDGSSDKEELNDADNMPMCHECSIEPEMQIRMRDNWSYVPYGAFGWLTFPSARPHTHLNAHCGNEDHGKKCHFDRTVTISIQIQAEVVQLPLVQPG